MLKATDTQKEMEDKLNAWIGRLPTDMYAYLVESLRGVKTPDCLSLFPGESVRFVNADKIENGTVFNDTTYKIDVTVIR